MCFPHPFPWRQTVRRQGLHCLAWVRGTVPGPQLVTNYYLLTDPELHSKSLAQPGVQCALLILDRPQ